MTTPHPRRVVITGLGTLNPLGNNVPATWESVKAGRSGIGPITLFDATDYETRIAGEVKGFDPVAHFGRKEARRMARLKRNRARSMGLTALRLSDTLDELALALKRLRHLRQPA